MARKDNAKLVAHVKRRKEQTSASASGNKFSQSQSKFERRAEESSVMESTETHSRFERARRRSGGVAPEQMSAGVHMSSRQKRANMFSLNEEASQKRDRSNEEAGSILGISFRNEDDQKEEVIPAKQAKQERFEDMITDSRRNRAQDKRDREERQQATTDVDKDFADVAHLLNKRDKRAEEYESFINSGSAELRSMIADHKEAQGGVSKKLVIGDSGSATLVSAPAKPAVAGAIKGQTQKSFLDSDDKALLAKITDGKPSAPVPTQEAQAAAAGAAETPASTEGEADDFDKMMGAMKMDIRKAHAVDRTLTEEEQAAEDEKQEKLRHLRSLGERVATEDQSLTRKEIIQRGGEAVHRMDGDAYGTEYSDDDKDYDFDDDERKEKETQDQKRKQQAHPLDVLLAEVEALCQKNVSTGVADMETKMEELLAKIYEVSRTSSKHCVETFRLFLMEGYRLMAKGKQQTQLNLVIYFICIKIFPLTDNRHPIITPLTLLLSSILIQIRLESLTDVKQGLIICSLLVHLLSAANKFSGEPFTFLFNVIGLAVPLQVLQPKAHEANSCPFPLMSRTQEALLGHHATSNKSLPEDARISIFASDSTKKGQQNPLVLLNVAYTTILSYMDACAQLAGIPALVDVFSQLHEFVGGAIPSKLSDIHLACLEKLQEVSTDAKKFRTPLAMRTFRPAPLRQFDPQLVEVMDEDKRELQDMKKDMREERKRVVRHVQAEATVERRARDREQTADASRREANLKKLMGELQQQQHVMKTVDGFRNKAKTKSKKGLSGAAGNKGGDDE